ncbi:hypothetical protein B0H67DRAFT_379430 [Lasiosphaeris hirsuta]|uniref:Uncharacterized protein n=1 Tax=Lasiosphaeris hirsuta TaxID=260670 RepID=A0AA40DLL3_9PEZI|nr:hypothetical protein B0H67DRAFT_379430 [Lasiosphaeris hirsuta]
MQVPNYGYYETKMQMRNQPACGKCLGAARAVDNSNPITPDSGIGVESQLASALLPPSQTDNRQSRIAQPAGHPISATSIQLQSEKLRSPASAPNPTTTNSARTFHLEVQVLFSRRVRFVCARKSGKSNTCKALYAQPRTRHLQTTLPSHKPACRGRLLRCRSPDCSCCVTWPLVCLLNPSAAAIGDSRLDALSMAARLSIARLCGATSAVPAGWLALWFRALRGCRPVNSGGTGWAEGEVVRSCLCKPLPFLLLCLVVPYVVELDVA